MNKLAIIIFLFSLTACGQQPSTKTAEIVQAKSSDKEQPKVNEGLKVVVVPSLPNFNEKTNVPTTKIFLSSSDFPELIFLVNDFSCQPMSPEEIRRLNIPMDAKFLFKSLYAGSGTNYYGLMKNGGIELYGQKFNDNGPEANPKVEPFNLIRKFNLTNRRPLDGFFICYDEDNKKELKMSIYFDSEGMANTMKFSDNNGWTPLQYNTSQVENDGAMPKTIDQYFEIFLGSKNGILNLTHSGNWDYASYTRTLDGKELNFTIDHETSLVGEDYRKDACF